MERTPVLAWACFLALASLAPVSGGQPEPPLMREGDYWVQIASGTMPIADEGKLRIRVRGPVTLRGGAEPGILRYRLRKSVRGGDEAGARRRLQTLGIAARQGEWTELSATGSGEERVTLALTVEAPRRLGRVLLETQGGGVEAYDIDGMVEAKTGGGRIHLDRLGGGATARTGGGEIRLGVVHGPVRCLSAGGSIRAERAGGEARLETAGGEIFLREALGTVHASTAGGNIHIARAAGAVFAHTAGGLIEVQQAGGAVTAETAGGSIQVGEARGVRCESSGGAIRLRSVTGALHASTAAGNILAVLAGRARLEDSFLGTGGGDVTVYIPSNLAVTVRAQNHAAGGLRRIISDFPEIQVSPDSRHTRSALAEGSLNGGGPLLKISASGGTIFLRRK